MIYLWLVNRAIYALAECKGLEDDVVLPEQNAAASLLHRNREGIMTNDIQYLIYQRF